eukprot:jgi/Ulvmu1/8061/UM004_0298.1
MMDALVLNIDETPLHTEGKRKRAQSANGKRARAGAHNGRQPIAHQENVKRQKHGFDRGHSRPNKVSVAAEVHQDAAPKHTEGGSEQHKALDSDPPSELDPDDLRAIADVLQAATSQENRIATEAQQGAIRPGASASPEAEDKHKADPPATNSAPLKSKTSHAAARDHVAKGQSDHMPRAAHKQVYGANASSFAELGLNELVCAHLQKMQYSMPTSVQQAVVPLLLKGRDVLMRAPTGTGKTLAYLAPMVQRLGAREPRISRSDGCHAVIVTPTRELTAQVYKVSEALAKRFIWLVPGMLVGGENRHHEKRRLRKGVVVLVATPGRLLDHLRQTESFVVSHLQWLVLDEADRLLDMGFQQTLSSIVELLDQRSAMSDTPRQSVLVSATLHSKLGAVAEELLSDPVAVGLEMQRDAAGNVALLDTGPPVDAFQLPKNLQQLYMDVPVKMRLPVLLGTLRLCCSRTPKCKAVVFVATCDSVDFLYQLVTAGFKAAMGQELLSTPVWRLHGDMEAKDRTESMSQFHACEAGVLLSTDVAARGLDFPAVTHILQYDAPGDVPEYVQRVGRTARMGRRGVAILLLAPGELEYVAELQRAGIAVVQQKLFPSLDALPAPPALSKRAAAEGDVRRRQFQVAMDAGHMCEARLIQHVSSEKPLHKLACTAFRSHIGAYATHASHLKGIFHVRKLHLGHVAHSFALKEQPRALGRAGAKRKPSKQQKPHKKKHKPSGKFK